MVVGLERRQEGGDVHFVTFSCFHRCAYFNQPLTRDLFEDALQKASMRFRFEVLGYVVIPEHVHLLVSEPVSESLAVALQGLKLSVARRARTRPFWLPRYYDFNVKTDAKRFEKLNYMHWNPVKRELVERPEDWAWSSYRYYKTEVQGRVTIKG